MSRRMQRQKYKRFADFVPSKAQCPRPDKHYFSSQESAEEFINSLYSRAARRYGQHYLPRRSYLCDCGGWHITSHPESTYKEES